MSLPHRTAVLVVTAAGLVTASSARAGHHNWDFTEIFSNADGSVQYIEIFTPANGEGGLGPFTITASGNTFNFVTNLPSTTLNKWALVATSNFAALPGAVTPDYILPASFFSTAGGTLNYAGGADLWNYGAVPTDGVNALQRDGSSAANSPTNFAGAVGSVDLSPSAPIPAVTAWGVIFAIGAILLLATGAFYRPRTA